MSTNLKRRKISLPRREKPKKVFKYKEGDAFFAINMPQIHAYRVCGDDV
jgi:hypothetical protein